MSAEDRVYAGLADAALIGAQDRYRALNMEIEVELTHTGGPLGYALIAWRQAAKEALINLAFQDPTDAKAVQALQNRIRIYFDAISDTAELLARGQQLWKEDGDGKTELARLVDDIQYPEGEDQEH